MFSTKTIIKSKKKYMEKRCIIGISDKYRFYSFIVEITKDERRFHAGVYIPDYEPSVFNKKVDAYRLRFAVWNNAQVDWIDVPFYKYDCLATPEFRENGHCYNEFIPIIRNGNDKTGRSVDVDKWIESKTIGDEPSLYVSLTVLEDDGAGNLIENPNFNSGQGTILLNNRDKKYGIRLVNRNGKKYITPFGPLVEISDTIYGPSSNRRYILKNDNDKLSMIFDNSKVLSIGEKDNIMSWGIADESTSYSYSVFKSFLKRREEFDDVKFRAYLMDNESGYMALEAKSFPEYNDNGSFYISNINLADLLESFRYKPTTPGLRIQCTITIRHKVEGDTNANQITSYITNIIPVNDELISSVFTDDFTIEKIYDTDMNINPVIIKDVTQQNIVEMKLNGDRNHIIQPLFFRVRELASITIHPHVKENICINLDAYKSNVKSFRIKIEGVVFSEIARVEAGVIFSISGPMLPGTARGGKYYILNEDGNLVTTGKYTYEY